MGGELLRSVGSGVTCQWRRHLPAAGGQAVQARKRRGAPPPVQQAGEVGVQALVAADQLVGEGEAWRVKRGREGEGEAGSGEGMIGRAARDRGAALARRDEHAAGEARAARSHARGACLSGHAPDLPAGTPPSCLYSPLTGHEAALLEPEDGAE